jgi:cold shock CspA family protein
MDKRDTTSQEDAIASFDPTDPLRWADQTSMYFDPNRSVYGFGKTYGEYSLNGKPLSVSTEQEAELLDLANIKTAALSSEAHQSYGMGHVIVSEKISEEHALRLRNALESMIPKLQSSRGKLSTASRQKIDEIVNEVFGGSRSRFQFLTPADILTPPNIHSGKVKWFNNRKGFACLETKSGELALLHYSAICGNKKILKGGEKLEFKVNRVKKKRTSTDVLLDETAQDMLKTGTVLYIARPFSPKALVAFLKSLPRNT